MIERTPPSALLVLLILSTTAAVWRISSAEEEWPGVGICDVGGRRACETAYMDCKLSFPVSDQQEICGCATIYYGACLPTAGCAAAEEMTSCIDELMTWDCPDMSVCGNDCTVEDGNPVIPADAVVLPVNNFGANYLQLSVCSKHVNDVKLGSFGQVSMERCSEDTFRVCDQWVAPRTLTAVAFPPEVTYLRVEQCVLMESGHDDGGSSSGSSSSGGNEEDDEMVEWECLEDPLPVEYYGTPLLWPSAVDVDYSTAALCEKDAHCPGSFCDQQQQPRICAPKMVEHFRRTGSYFLDPRWKILDLAAAAAGDNGR